MKKTVLAIGVSMIALTATASAADDGYYMGLGITFNDNNPDTTHSVAPSTGAGWFTVANRAAINAATTNDLTSNHVGAAIFGGYRMHLTDIITGAIEVDASVFDGVQEDTHVQAYPTPPGTFTMTQYLSQQWISTLRAKLGADLPAGLPILGGSNVFVTGGAAITDVELKGTFSDTYPAPSTIPLQAGLTSDMKIGFVWGGGIDLPLGGSTTLRVEYLHHDFGSIDYARNLTFITGLTAGNEVLRGSADLETNVVRVGLSWNL